MDTTKSATSERAGVQLFISDFFTHYYTERNCEKVLLSLSRQVLFVGLNNGEVTRSRAACEPLLRAQMEAVPKPIPYFVTNFT